MLFNSIKQLTTYLDWKKNYNENENSYFKSNKYLPNPSYKLIYKEKSLFDLIIYYK